MKMVDLSPGIAGVNLFHSVNYSLYHRKLYDWSEKKNYLYLRYEVQVGQYEIKEDKEQEQLTV